MNTLKLEPRRECLLSSIMHSTHMFKTLSFPFSRESVELCLLTKCMYLKRSPRYVGSTSEHCAIRILPNSSVSSIRWKLY